MEASHLGVDDVTNKLRSLKLSNEVQLKKKVTEIFENIMLDGGMCVHASGRHVQFALC